MGIVVKPVEYHSLSKFEINRLVAQRLGMSTDKEGLSDSTFFWDFNKRYPNTVWAQKSGEPWEQFCFTGEAEQWGGLVTEYSIALRFDTCQVHAKSYFSDCQEVSFSRKDIGIAVSIAFLLMKDYQAANGG